MTEHEGWVKWAEQSADNDLAAALARAERAEAALAAVPVYALRRIAERERHMWPPTDEIQALNTWLDSQP